MPVVVGGASDSASQSTRASGGEEEGEEGSEAGGWRGVHEGTACGCVVVEARETLLSEHMEREGGRLQQQEVLSIANALLHCLLELRRAKLVHGRSFLGELCFIRDPSTGCHSTVAGDTSQKKCVLVINDMTNEF